MLFNIGDIIYDTLTNAFSGKVGVYPIIQADENGKLPFVAYRRSAYEPAYSKDLYSKIDTYYYSVGVVSDKYKEGVDIAEEAINALMSIIGTEVNGHLVQDVKITNATETAGEDLLFVQDLDFAIKVKK